MSELTGSVAASLPPRLAFVVGDGLAAFKPATDVLRQASPAERESVEQSLALLARDARGLVGYERLPDPVLAWATVGPDGEVGLRRALPGGKLELRRWEGRFTLFRRIRQGGRAAIEAALAMFVVGADELGEPDRVEVLVPPQGASPGVTLCEWVRKIREGRFERLVVVGDGKDFSFLLAPPYGGWKPIVSHESAPDLLMKAAAARPRPPGATALPAPLAMPAGGRFANRRSRKRRRSGPGSADDRSAAR